MNQSETPEDAEYAGNWKVYSKDGKKVVLTVNYLNGKKQGKEVSWFNFPNSVRGEQSYTNGILHGSCIRYESDGDIKPVLVGEYRNGVPWSGEFLLNMNGDVVDSISFPIVEIDAVYRAAKYVNGKRLSVFELAEKRGHP